MKLGKRMPNDFLVQYRKESSNKGKANLVFQTESSVKITEILVFANVRTLHFKYLKKMLTILIDLLFYLFSFQSTWAIGFTNKIIMTENRFQATVYELKRNEFQANVFIFGTKET